MKTQSMPPNGATRVVVSWHEVDAPWGRALAAWLRGLGLEVWDASQLQVGDRRLAETQRELQDADALVLVVTPEWATDRFGQLEWQTALYDGLSTRRDRRLLPVLLRWAPTPFLLADLMVSRPDGASDGGRAELARLATALLGREVGPREVPGGLLPGEPELPGAVWERLVRLFEGIAADEILQSVLKERAPRWIPDAYSGAALKANAWLVERLAPGRRVALAIDELGVFRRTFEREGRGGEAEAVQAELRALLGRRSEEPRGGTTDLRRYLEKLRRELDEDLPSHFGESGPARRLTQIYVELRATDRCGDGALRELVRDGESGAAPHRGRRVEDEVLRDGATAFSLLGEPGSGKSTLLRSLAIGRIDAALAALDAREDLPVASIPVVIPLPAYRHPIAWLRSVTEGRGYPPEIADRVEEQARAGRALFLLDGLDEVEPARMKEVLASVRALACDDLVERGCRVVVTSRFFGYTRPAQRFRELQLLPLGCDEQTDLLERHLGPDDARALALYVKDEVDDAGLSEIAGNPFLLTLVALVARAQLETPDGTESAGAARTTRKIRLPRKRPALLRAATDLLLEGRPGRPGHPTFSLPSLPLVRPALEDLSLALLRRGAGPYPEAHVHRDVVASEAYAALPGLWGDAALTPATFLERIAGCSELLVAIRHVGAETCWRLPHRSLQEHLASAALARLGPPVWEEEARRIGEGLNDAFALAQWSETFALLPAEVHQDADPLLRRLAEVNEPLAIHALACAAPGTVREETLRALLRLEEGPWKWESRMKVIRQIPEQLGETAAAVRLLRQIRGGTKHGADLYFVREALEALTRASDATVALAAQRELEPGRFFRHLHRPPALDLEVLRLPDGSERPYWCELPDPGGLYRIGCVPVTNELYERFDPGHREGRQFADRVKAVELDRHPVVDVTWYEAETFCRWLRQSNQGVRLPTEAEWEHAATGGDPKRTFPWGNARPDKKRARYDQGWDKGSTASVGSFPDGAGPHGTLDQAGNVWEWCEDLLKADSPHAVRPLRGGSWSDLADFLAAASRGRSGAVYRDRSIGFRVVCPARPEP